MEKIKKSWSEMKTFFNTQCSVLNYEDNSDDFYIWIVIGKKEFYTQLPKNPGNEDYDEFIADYKPIADICYHPFTADGKEIVRSESRPLGTTTHFTSVADSDINIGNGIELFWDFSNDDDILSMPSGSSSKRKRIEFKFLDSIWMKEGTLYFHNTKKRSYIDFYVVCPEGEYYYDNDGESQQATEDTPIISYGTHLYIQGDCPMGDELNTESCSEEIKNNYKFWLDITVPNTDDDSNGYVILEVFRERTVIL